MSITNLIWSYLFNFLENIIPKKDNKFTTVLRDTLTVLPFTAISIPRETTFVPCVHAILLGWASITVNGPLAPILITIVCCGLQNGTFVGYIWRESYHEYISKDLCFDENTNSLIYLLVLSDLTNCVHQV